MDNLQTKRCGGLTIKLDEDMSPSGFDWDGVDVNDILKSELFKIDEYAHFKETIPEGVVTKGRSTSEPMDENSLHMMTTILEIIAVDKSGVALIRETTLDDYLDAEWSNVAAMPLSDAEAEISKITQQALSSNYEPC